MNSIIKIVALALGMSSPALVAHAQDAAAPVLPGGASSISEVFGDWVVDCGLVVGARACALSQEQTLEGGQRLLLINLQPKAAGEFDVVLVLPFGLLLAQGLSAQVDGQPWRQDALQFRTCQPIGCVVQASFGLADMAALRSGTNLQLVGVTDEGGEYAFNIPLAGLTAAMDRSLVLRQ